MNPIAQHGSRRIEHGGSEPVPLRAAQAWPISVRVSTAPVAGLNQAGESLRVRFRLGLALLLQAHDYAADARFDQWQFALSIAELCGGGLSLSDLRWLAAKGLVSHGVETTVRGAQLRSFDCGVGLAFGEGACFVLTMAGVRFARHELAAADDVAAAGEAAGLRGEAGSPTWDAGHRELRIRQVVVKRFRVPAHNQEVILGAFEDEGWPQLIDDPLPPRHGMDSRTRLHDAINRLNGRQLQPLLRFHGNGTGTGISWEMRLDALSAGGCRDAR